MAVVTMFNEAEFDWDLILLVYEHSDIVKIG